jgi:hypothetical protein
MSRYENVQLCITHHAYQQYCQRVGAADREEITLHCRQHLQRGDYERSRQNEWFIQIGGVWWVYEQEDIVMNLITCYGQTTFDLPAALKWAARNNDQLNLKQLLGIGGSRDEHSTADS